MTYSWYESRKDIFIRDLLRDFFEAKNFFDVLYNNYKTISAVPYSQVDIWIGTETRKGPLWTLKDQSHRLFRHSGDKKNLFEHLFDWTIGSIFYAAIKLKEDAYQIESYKPLLEHEASKENKALSKIINEYFNVIESAQKNLKTELDRINALYNKAIFHLIEILPLYRNNVLLVRFFLDNKKKLLDKIFGKQSYNHILERMFPDGLQNAYLTVAEKCVTSGWPKDARRYLKKALQVDNKNQKANELLKTLKEQ